MLKLAFGVRGALHENFPNDARRTFVQRIFRKLARKAIEDRSSKISQTMRVENCSKNISEVGQEVHRRSLHENFPNDARRNWLKDGFGSWRGRPSKIAPRKFPNRHLSALISPVRGRTGLLEKIGQGFRIDIRFFLKIRVTYQIILYGTIQDFSKIF